MTIELTQESSGRLTGKFFTPVPMEFTQTSFDPKTHAVVLEAMDRKSGKRYRIACRIQGTELTECEVEFSNNVRRRFLGFQLMRVNQVANSNTDDGAPLPGGLGSV